MIIGPLKYSNTGCLKVNGIIVIDYLEVKMGAWGEKILENDSAQDFIHELNLELKNERAYSNRRRFIKDLAPHISNIEDNMVLAAVEFCLSRRSLRKIISQELKDMAKKSVDAELAQKELSQWENPQARKEALLEFLERLKNNQSTSKNIMKKPIDESVIRASFESIDEIRSTNEMGKRVKAVKHRREVILYALAHSQHQFWWSCMAKRYRIAEAKWPKRSGPSNQKRSLFETEWCKIHVKMVRIPQSIEP